MARLSKEERRQRRQERRAARKAAHHASPASTGVTSGRPGRRERRALRRAAKLEAKLSIRPREPVERGPVTNIVVGKRSRFTDAQMAHHNLDLIRECPWGDMWIMRYEGDGYVDGDSFTDRDSLMRTLGHFKVCFKEVKVVWLK